MHTKSRATQIRIINFECIEDALIEFDERGIIIIKGYNDSGKSAITHAIKVLVHDWKPRLQADYIQDGKGYFRIIMYFDDGIIILRDKYSSGASLYNMYKGELKEENIIFSTCKEGVYTSFDDVPEPIAKYLGLVAVDSMYLNARNSDDPLLLVHTTGSDNYKFLSEVLHSDELALASRLLNTDKNKKQAELNEMSSTITVYRKEYNALFGITENLVKEVERLDSNLSDKEEKLKIINDINVYNEERNSIEILPMMESIDTDKLITLANLLKNLEDTSKPIAPIIETLDSNRLRDVYVIRKYLEEVTEIKVPPVLSTLSSQDLSLLKGVLELYLETDKINQQIEENKRALSEYTEKIIALQEKLKKEGVRTLKCDSCGNVMTVGAECLHE